MRDNYSQIISIIVGTSGEKRLSSNFSIQTRISSFFWAISHQDWNYFMVSMIDYIHHLSQWLQHCSKNIEYYTNFQSRICFYVYTASLNTYRKGYRILRLNWEKRQKTRSTSVSYFDILRTFGHADRSLNFLINPLINVCHMSRLDNKTAN